MRPFVFINAAMSLDGKISNERRERVKISTREDFEIVDRLRAESDAVMVGIGTILADNPRLTVKSEKLREERVKKGKQPNPIRVIVDSRARTPPNARVLNNEAETIIAVSKIADEERIEKLKEKADVIVLGDERVDLKALLGYLYRRGVRKLMVEGGSELNASLIRERLVDEVRVFYSGMIIGGASAPTLVGGRSFDPPIRAELKSYEVLGNGVAITWKIK